MSKRAEEAALRAFPEMDMYMAANPHKTQLKKERRRCYKQGYEQAEKDTIERAIQWLIAHADDYIVDMEVSRYEPSKLIVGGMCWENLKKAMEED